MSAFATSLVPCVFRSLKLSVPPRGGRNRMAFLFRLEHEDGTPADPRTFRTAVPSWRPGDVIPLGGRSLRVVDVRDADD
jgi:hypothetical protein